MRSRKISPVNESGIIGARSDVKDDSRNLNFSDVVDYPGRNILGGLSGDAIELKQTEDCEKKTNLDTVDLSEVDMVNLGRRGRSFVSR